MLKYILRHREERSGGLQALRYVSQRTVKIERYIGVSLDAVLCYVSLLCSFTVSCLENLITLLVMYTCRIPMQALPLTSV